MSTASLRRFNSTTSHNARRDIIQPFSAFWLRSSVVSVLFSLISETWFIEPYDINLIFWAGGLNAMLAWQSHQLGLGIALQPSSSRPPTNTSSIHATNNDTCIIKFLPHHYCSPMLGFHHTSNHISPHISVPHRIITSSSHLCQHTGARASRQLLCKHWAKYTLPTSASTWPLMASCHLAVASHRRKIPLQPDSQQSAVDRPQQSTMLQVSCQCLHWVVKQQCGH